MTTVEKINVILREANISKVNLAKYLNVSRQMVYNYLDGDDLSKLSNDKCQLLFKLLNVKTEEELKNVELTDEYIQQVGSKIFNSKKSPVKKSEIIELTGLRKEEQDLISDIVFQLKEFLNEDKTKSSQVLLTYICQFLQAVGNNKEMKYILGYVSKSLGYTNPNVYAFEEEQQFIFESIMYSAMTLYNNGGASRTKLAESHKRWETELSRKNEEKLSRTQELNTAKVQALRELGYDEINESNASEVFDKIAEIQSRWASV
jgi:predicted transcriptional regulator